MIQLKYWNSDNVLVKWIDEEQQVNEEYYDNGELYKRTFSQEKKYEDQYFLSKSQWLMTCDYYQANDKDSFNASLILKELPNLTALFHRSVIACFARYLINNNKQLALEFLSQLSQHQEAYFRSEAASLLGQLQLLAGIPYLQALLNDHEKPFVDDRFEVGGFGNLLPINERATRAIQQIRQHQKNE
ncbi:hypothetical protein BGP_1412 [Beggiatoa sp. PS]|nr:hypothetical protein BGP_1412 [Beggiatoa sp. PS]